MNNLITAVKVVFAIVAAIALLLVASYVAGLIYFGLNKSLPVGITPVTWIQHYQAYGFNAPYLAASMAISVVALLIVCLLPLYHLNKTPLHGESRFSYRREIREAGLFKGGGIIVGKYGGKFLQFVGDQFVSLAAPTRSGKGVGVVIPNMLNWHGSVVATDVKLELFKITSKYRALFSEVFLFNPFSETTHQYNALGYVSDDPIRRVSETLSIGYILYPPQTNDSIWNDSARNLFMALALYLLEIRPKDAHLPGVLRESAGHGKPLAGHLVDLIEAHTLSSACVSAMQRFINAPANTAGGILTTFNAALTIFASPIVAAATSSNSFDLRQIRKRKMSIYVGVPVNKIAESRLIRNLFYSQLIQLNTDELFGDDGNNVRVLLALDEFMSMGALAAIADGSGFIAGYGMRMLSVFQAISQMEKPVSEGGYGVHGANAVLENHALDILFTPKGNKDSREYSEMLGDETVKAESRNIRKMYEGTVSEQKRPFMTPQQVRRIPQTKQIIHLEGLRPFMCDKIRYYNEPVFIDRLKSVSQSLAALGKKLPTEQQLTDAWKSGELSSYVPTNDVLLVMAKNDNRTRPVTVEDVAAGVDLDKLTVDTTALTTYTDDMTDEQVSEYVDEFMAAMNSGVMVVTEPITVVQPAAKSVKPTKAKQPTKLQPALPDAAIDRATGEIIDLSVLN